MHRMLHSIRKSKKRKFMHVPSTSKCIKTWLITTGGVNQSMKHNLQLTRQEVIPENEISTVRYGKLRSPHWFERDVIDADDYHCTSWSSSWVLRHWPLRLMLRVTLDCLSRIGKLLDLCGCIPTSYTVTVYSYAIHSLSNILYLQHWLHWCRNITPLKSFCSHLHWWCSHTCSLPCPHIWVICCWYNSAIVCDPRRCKWWLTTVASLS